MGALRDRLTTMESDREEALALAIQRDDAEGVLAMLAGGVSIDLLVAERDGLSIRSYGERKSTLGWAIAQGRPTLVEALMRVRESQASSEPLSPERRGAMRAEAVAAALGGRVDLCERIARAGGPAPGLACAAWMLVELQRCQGRVTPQAKAAGERTTFLQLWEPAIAWIVSRGGPVDSLIQDLPAEPDFGSNWGAAGRKKLLHLAGTANVARALLAAGADANAMCAAGWTPLGVAVKSGKKELIQALVEGGARIDACGNGQDAVLVAKLSGRPVGGAWALEAARETIAGASEEPSRIATPVRVRL